ncbi:MAG: transporter substrate-binding protein [Betaproteobacteria bacterium]|jgi:tripartite-type tricarboxylate transporter receptor subunit TctC|nr:transporter substrate-binding protein [Betaproteobacteria bacterium]
MSGAAFSAIAIAQSYPTRPVRFVVPLAPGGAGDIVARTVAAKLSDVWGGQVIIDNRGGANTIIGTDFVAKAKPDGYTWLLGVQGSLAINPAFYMKLPYDAVNDFDPVTQMTRYGYVLVVHPALPVKRTPELVALARTRPGDLAYGTSGTGGSNHLAGELFRLMTGVKMNAIPYKGSAPALTALLSGEVQLMFDTMITSIPLIKSGRVRALAVSLPKRSPSLPNVPTLAESGVPGYRFDAWQAIVVPAGTPKDIVRRIQQDVVRVLAMPDVRRALVDEGANEIVGSTPEEFGSHIRSEIERYRKLIAEAGIERQ